MASATSKQPKKTGAVKRATKKVVAASLLAAQLAVGSAAGAETLKVDLAVSAVRQQGRDFSAIAERYCRDVLSEKISACMYIKLACKEHLDDLQRQYDDDFEYRYDAEKGERVCRYIEKFPHIKGEWADNNEKLVLTPWMVFATCRLFGMVRKVNGFRRFREFYAEVPRKNGKTTLVAAWAHYLAFYDNEPGADVFIGASKLEQALECFDAAAQQLENTRRAVKKFRLVIGKRIITGRFKGTRCRIRAVAKKPGDGGSPHGAVLDELHEHEKEDLRESMRQGTGARRQSLLIQITTAGYDINGVCYRVRQQAINVLTGITQNPRLFALIYTIDADDNPLSREAYIKANPNLGVSIKAEDLEAELLVAISEPAEAFNFRTKKLNVWGQSARTYFNVNAWMTRCLDPELVGRDAKGKLTRRNPGIPERFLNRKKYALHEGFDLAGRLDLGSRVKIFTEYWNKPRDGRPAGRHYFVFGRHYAPIMTINDGRHGDYQEWYSNGWLVGCEGACNGYELDLESIQQEVIIEYSAWQPAALAFDQAFALQMQQTIERAVGEGIVVTVPQTAKELSDGMKEFGAAIVSGRVHHNGDPLLQMAIANVISRPDPNENEFPRKEKPENKIDPATATLIGMNRVMAMTIETSVPYRGLRSA